MLDLLAAYWLLVKILLYVSAVVIFISSLDDFMIDLWYWTRRFYRFVRMKDLPTEQLHARVQAKAEQLIAVMVPAWQEWAVIGKMAQLAAKNYSYRNYHIFIGTYPNDHQTQKAVDEVCRQYPNIHKVVTRNPGPTSKADCLNHVIEAIYALEKAQHCHFDIIAYHDAEDVVHPMELKVFNYFVPDYDLLQVPVYPLKRHWYSIVSDTYIDEFGEFHSKDVIVRESMTGQVSSAGVGTAFSRKAIQTLARLNHGQVFNENSLTEDYEIGYHLHAQGLKERFILFPTPNEDMPFLSVREFFPNRMQQSIRQKSRWIVGIVFQGWKNIGWPRKSLAMLYMLARDRKAVITNPINLVAYFIVLNLLFMTLYTHYDPDAWWFPDLIPNDSWLWHVLMINGLFLANRIIQRVYFITRLYGLHYGLLSIPRMVIGNIINFMAYFRALKQVREVKKQIEKVAWDKTDHEFPDP